MSYVNYYFDKNEKLYKVFFIICQFLGFTSTLLLGGALLSYNAKNIINDKFKKSFF